MIASTRNDNDAGFQAFNELCLRSVKRAQSLPWEKENKWMEQRFYKTGKCTTPIVGLCAQKWLFGDSETGNQLRCLIFCEDANSDISTWWFEMAAGKARHINKQSASSSWFYSFTLVPWRISRSETVRKRD